MPATAPSDAATARLAGERTGRGEPVLLLARAPLVGGFAGAERFWDALWWNVLIDLPEGLDTVRCPVTLVQGGLDAVAPGHAPRYLALIPGARLETLPLAGHAPQADAPGQVERIVRATIRRAGGERPGR